MMEEFGPRLRRERERRRISLESISANTKVSVSLFRSLERDDVSRWPSGIFRRAFIRSYAAAIGLDPDELVQEFLERFPDPRETPAAPAAASHGSSIRPHPGSALRLTLAEAGQPFSGGRLLRAHWRRIAAALVDATVAALVGVGLFLTVGAFWMPLALFTLAYYCGGILLLGNTPGVCLFAPAPADQGHDSPRPASSRRPFSLAALLSRRAHGAGNASILPRGDASLAPQ
jgi:transcriptional regulator with XRE-family HTH domain